MPEKMTKNLPVTEPDVAEAPVEPTAAGSVPPTKARKTEVSTRKESFISRVPLWGWIVTAAIVFFALVGVVATSYAVVHSLRKGDAENKAMGDYALRDDQLGSGRSGGFGNGMMGDRGGFSMRNSASSSTRVSGVVTAVDGDTITVAGNGTTTKVKVTSSTIYSGSSEPATVNDTITAIGTTTDDVFTASSVRLVRQ